MRVDAQIGGYDAVYYPALQMALQGSRALAVTDCLNFGNPQKKEIMSEFVAAVEAIAEASKKLDAPVISGNVSFYNETQTQNIISTPATGLIGIRNDVEDLWSNNFTISQDSILSIKYNWVESYIGIGGEEFRLNSEAAPDLFILQLQKMGEELRKDKDLFSSISAIRSIALGGVKVTLEKMQSEKITSQILPNLPDTEINKDCFYGFLLTTCKEKALITWLANYFSDLPDAKGILKIEVVGATRDR